MLFHQFFVSLQASFFTSMFLLVVGVHLKEKISLENPFKDPVVVNLNAAVALSDGQGVSRLEAGHMSWITNLAEEDSDAGVAAMQQLLRHGQTPEAQAFALDGIVALETSDWPEDYRGEFLRALAPGALQAGIASGVPVSITMAQAIQESGWGRSSLARNHNNLFGVKGSAHNSSVSMRTEEFSQGRSETIQARFRTFDTWADSIGHHSALLSTDPRYAQAYAQPDWQGCLRVLAPVYASDPQYDDKVSWLIQRYNLDRWDGLVRDLAARPT